MIQEEKLDSAPIKQTIIRLQKTLNELRECGNKEEEFRKLLEDVAAGLQSLDVPKVDPVPTFTYDILKPLSREITNFYPREIKTFQAMKSTILSIVRIYMQIFCDHHFDAILEIMKQLLQRENMLFVRSFKSGAGAGVPASAVEKAIAEQGRYGDEQEEKRYKWSRGRLGYTTFHRDCCQIIFPFISTLPPNHFHKMRLCSIKQLMSFMTYFQDFIYQQQMQKFITQSYSSLRRTFIQNKISKQLVKQSNKQTLQQISQKMNKMLYYYSDKSLKQSILLLGPEFAVNLFVNAQTIETRLYALRILEKFAHQYYFRGGDALKEDVFAEWLVEKGLWDVVIGKHVEWAVVKSCEYILKMIVNKKSSLISQQRFKQFLTMIWQTTQDNRKCYLKSFDPLRLSYTQLINLIQSLKMVQQNGQLYNNNQQFFYLVEQISRYGVDSQRRAAVQILLSVMKRHYLGWKSYSTQRKALDSMKYCFQKLADAVKDTTQRGVMYVNVIESFIQSPDYLTLSISRKLFQSEQKKNSYALQKAAKTLVQQKHIIETIIELMSQQLSYSQQLLYFLKAILEKYKSYNCTMSLSLPEDIMVKATKYPEVFTQLVNFSNPDDCKSLLYKLFVESYNREVNFQSIKQLFYKVNYLFVKVVEAEYFRKKQYKVKVNPDELYFIKDLQMFLITCKFTDAQQKCAELIASVYTSFSEGYMEKGRVKMKEFMREIRDRVVEISIINELFEQEEYRTEVYGLLCLVKELLETTEVQGVGELKAHNALVTTSMLKVKIWNNAAYGDDVQKCFQKSLPSNMTLFQLLTILSDKFKCGQHQLYLQQGSNLSLPPKLNGLTLLQLGFNHFKQYSAYKNTKVQIKKQPLKLQNNQLNPLFLNIIKQIFRTYSHDNKMGEQQIINYIRGVTNSQSHNKDSRVLYLLREYDLDKDGYLTEEDLIRFYGDSCDGGEKEDNVWGNLANLHYRNDLRKFNQPIGPVEEQDLFRHYLKSSHKTYALLFNICHLKHSKLASLAKQLLGHLPTCQTLVADFSQPLNLENKSSFEISYILINVRFFLEKENQQLPIERKPKVRNHNNCDKMETGEEEESESMQRQQQEKGVKVNHDKGMSYVQKFLKNKNDLIIFALIQTLTQKQHKDPQEQLLIAVSLNILRTLLHIPSLSESYLRNEKLNYEDLQHIVSNRNKLNIQNYQFFISMISQSMKHANFAALQPALALSLNKQALKWQQWMYEGLFHQEGEIRKLTLNFLLFYCIENDFPINFFELNIAIVRQRCEQWFILLFFYLHSKKAVSKDILQGVMKTLSVEGENIDDGRQYNPILNGNLSLLLILINHNPSSQSPTREQLYALIQDVIDRTLSNENRFLCYQIMTMLNPKSFFIYMYNLIRSVKPTDTYQPKQNFVGIKNLGSTCYMNSILQQFYTISKFKKMVMQFPLLQIPPKSTVNNVQIVDDFLYQLQKMYTYLQLSNKKYYVPKQFCLTIKDYNKKPINTSIQQDAHEFLNNLFDKIQTYMKQAGMLQNLQQVFQGKTVCEISCKECNTKKSKIQDFYHLALEVKNVQNLQQSFRKFILPQTIQDYYCEKCEKKSQQITKQTLINALPEVLIVNLQRIVFDLESFQKVKVHSKLEFPAQLNLHQFIHSDSPYASNSLYRLKGVVIHSGTSQGGHYYSLIKINNEWYKFNDETVSRFVYSDLERQAYGGSSDGYGEGEFSTNAYILFYERGQEEYKQKDKSQEMESELTVGNEIKQKSPQQQQNQHQQQHLPQPHPHKPLFHQQVLHQNTLFYQQLQLHQQSFFHFVTTIYPNVRPTPYLKLSQKEPFYSQWRSIVQLESYELLLKIFMEMLKFMQVFCELPRKILTETGQAIYELLQILPEETYKVIHYQEGQDKHTNGYNITIQQWAQTICTHSQITIRQLHKVVLNKIIYVYVKYYGWTYKHKTPSYDQKITGTAGDLMMQEQKQQLQQNQQSQQSQQDPLSLLLQHFIHPSTIQTVTKNLYKSYYYFQFWSVNLQMDTNLQQFCLCNNFLFILLDLLMGNESPYANKDKKRQDLPYEMAPPLLQCVLRLLHRKRNCANAIPFKQQSLSESQYYPLTQQQSTLLTSPSFYRRMIRLKYDNGILSQIISFMSLNDRQISANFCQLFLVGLNSIDEIQNSLSLLHNIKSFLLIGDGLQQERTKWMLGIAQFDYVGKMAYGLRYSNQSFNIVYVSSRYFIADEKYKPALQVLHDKRCYFSDFEVNGIITLLQIVLNNQHALKHLLSLPPPSNTYTNIFIGYLYKNYLSWVIEYSNKLSTEDHYGLTMDKKFLAQSLENVIKLLLKRISTLPQQPITPILPKIIGRNKILSLQQEIENQVYTIRKYVHETYVLQNLPLQNQKGNLSLPDDVFSIKEPKSYAVYFIQNTDIDENNQDGAKIQTQKTVITLEIDTKKPLKLTFLLPNFNHQIHINKGKKMMINYPYTEFPLQGYLQVQIKQQSIIQQGDNTTPKMTQLKLSSHNQHSRMQIEDTYGPETDPNAKKDYEFDSRYNGETAGYTNDQIIEVQCPVCTFFNDVMRTKCEMCENLL